MSISVSPIELKDNKPVKNEASKRKTSKNNLFTSNQREDSYGSRNNKTISFSNKNKNIQTEKIDAHCSDSNCLLY